MILVEVSDATKANTSMQMQASDPMPCTNPLTELKAAESAAGLAPGSICGGGCPSLVDARGSRCRFNDERGTDALPRLRLVPAWCSLRIVPVACLDFHLHVPCKDIPDWDLCFLDCVVLTLVLADCPHLHIREKVI